MKLLIDQTNLGSAVSVKQATLYRMVTDKHLCPFGIKAKDLLTRKGYQVKDHQLKSREQIDAFKTTHDVKTTPQIVIGEERIGGYEELRAYLGLSVVDRNQVTYKPIIAIFSIALLMAAALHWAMFATVMHIRFIEWFIAISMCVLAIQKLSDLNAFSNQFITYDLLAMRYVPYAYMYPFAEAFAGIGMLSGALSSLVAVVALFIGTIGAVSVVKAVYLDKREIKCACVGGNSNVPLGFISLTENLFMVGMGIWMIINLILVSSGVKA